MHSVVLLIWLALCAAQDIHRRHIANGLTLGAVLLSLGYLLWTGTTWLGAGAGQGGWALLLALLFTVPGYAVGRLGAGDVKLMAALGLATDPLHLLGTFIGAGVTSVLWLLIASGLWRYMNQSLAGYLQHLDPRQSKKYAFAPFVFLGMVLTVLWIR